MQGRFDGKAPGHRPGVHRRIRSLLLNSVWFWLGDVALAHAGPLAGAVAAIGGLWAAIGPIGQLVVTVGAQIGLSLLQKALSPTASGTSESTGISTQASFGDSTPIGFPIGQTATAGTFIYGGEWGNSGGTPNAYSTDVYVLSDLPIADEPGIWVNGQKCTIDWGATPTDQGYPVTDFRTSGVDHLWVRYLDGTQVAADTFLTDKFGSDPDRPWKSTMVGIGTAIVIVTALYDRDLFQNFNKYLFEPGQPAFYDISKDSTAGGSGSHLWSDPSTWEPTSNPKVIAYNLMRGVYYGTEWLYGGQNLAAARLPASNWIAAIGACSTQIDLAAGGTEDQFRCGYYVTGDMEPLSVVEELDKASSAYTAEVGGMFKTIAGAPGAAVYSFTDGDVLITKPQDLAPFPGFSDTHNTVQATFPDPTAQWQSASAPDLVDTDLIAADAGFDLPVSIAYAAVPFATQVQRLMKAAQLTGRRFLVHTIYLPPDAWSLEPGVDVLAWTSAANGYTDKAFLLTAKEGEPGFQQKCTLLEIDPGADYAWSTADEKPVAASYLSIVRPAPQLVSGWTAAPGSFLDDDGVARHPSITITATGGMADVRALRVQVRLTSSGALVYDGDVPYDSSESSPAWTLNGTFLADTAYQVRGKLLPFSGRVTYWSNQDTDGTEGAWLDVTTPVVVNADVTNVQLTQLSQDLQNIIGLVFGNDAGSIASMLNDLQAKIAAQAAANLDDQATNKVKTTSLAVQTATAAAAVVTEQQARIDGDTAEATARTEAIAAIGTAIADGLISFDSVVTGGGAEATIAIKVRAQTGDIFADSGILIKATSDGLGGTTSQILLNTDQLFVTDGTNVNAALTFDATTGTITAAKLQNTAGTMVIDLTAGEETITG